MSKYGATPTEIYGIRFASKAEARRYQQLSLMESAGVIRDLELQPPYDLIVSGTKVGKYVGDFRYWDNERNESVVEDVKGVLTPVYRLKKRMVKAQYGIEIKEVKA